VVGIGQTATLIEVVDAPDKAPLYVAPSAEVLSVKVAHTQHQGYVLAVQFLADFRPPLRPSVESSTQKLEWSTFGNPFVSLFHLFVYERYLRAKPTQIAFSRILEILIGRVHFPLLLFSPALP